MKINRIFSMPNKKTFSMKPVKNKLSEYILDGKIWIDGFANSSSLATITNDLNPEFETDYNLDCLDFFKTFPDSSVDGVLFDPPYSFNQSIICYNGFKVQKITPLKNEIKRILKPNGICISFGWNTNGLGKKRNFKLIEILIVCHGGNHNDTLITIEKKL